MLKRCGFMALLVLLLALLVGCDTINVGSVTIRGSGKPATRDYPLTGFTGISANSGFQVTVTGGDSFKVSVTADDNMLDVLSVRTQGNTLIIEVDSTKARSINTTILKAAVTLPTLLSVSVNGGAHLGVGSPAPQTGTLTVNGNGGGSADLSGMAAQTASVTLNGGASARIKVTGTLNYDLNGGAHLDYTGKPTLGSVKTDGGASASAF